MATISAEVCGTERQDGAGGSKVRRKPSRCDCTGRMNSPEIGTRKCEECRASRESGQRGGWNEFGERMKFNFVSARNNFWPARREKFGGRWSISEIEREYFSELLDPVQGIEGGRTSAALGAESGPIRIYGMNYLTQEWKSRRCEQVSKSSKCSIRSTDRCCRS